jgi:hypothetical protein
MSARSRGFLAESRRITRSNQASSPRRLSPAATAISQAMTEASAWSTRLSVGQATEIVSQLALSGAGDSRGRLGQRAGMSLEYAAPATGFPHRPYARRCAPLALVFVRVKNVGRGRHQPTATGGRSGSLRDSDRKAIVCQSLRLGLGLDCALRVDVSTTEPTPERAEEVHGSDSRRVAAGRRSSGPVFANVTRARP